MRVAKYLGVLALIVIALVTIVLNFSSIESRFECSGKLSAGQASKPATVYIRLATYRSWVGLWSDSNAALWLEIPNETVDYFERVVKSGDQLQIYGPKKDIKGNFSTLSRALTLSTPKGFFDGVCKRIDA
jgi:hypothetical protein